MQGRGAPGLPATLAPTFTNTVKKSNCCGPQVRPTGVSMDVFHMASNLSHRTAGPDTSTAQPLALPAVHRASSTFVAGTSKKRAAFLLLWAESFPRGEGQQHHDGLSRPRAGLFAGQRSFRCPVPDTTGHRVSAM
jgi:hypothetical protein